MSARLAVQYFPPAGALPRALGPRGAHRRCAASLAPASRGEPVRSLPRLQPDGYASGIHTAFYFAAGCCVLSAIASWMRGGKYIHTEVPVPVEGAELAEAA